MGWKGDRMDGERLCSLGGGFRDSRENGDESMESSGEGGRRDTLLSRGGIRATLLNPRQDYGSGYDQEKHTEIGPKLNPEPEGSPGKILGRKEGQINFKRRCTLCRRFRLLVVKSQPSEPTVRRFQSPNEPRTK